MAFALAGCQPDSPPYNPQPMKEALSIARVSLLALGEDASAIPAAWEFPAGALCKPENEPDLWKLMSGVSEDDLLNALRQRKIRHLLLDRKLPWTKASLGAALTSNTRLSHFHASAVSRRFVLITRQEQPPDPTPAALKLMFAAIRAELAGAGAPDTSGLDPLWRKPWQSMAGLVIRRDGRQIIFRLGAGPDMRSAALQAVERIRDGYTGDIALPGLLKTARIELHFFSPITHLDEPDEELVNEWLIPGEQGLELQRWYSREKGREFPFINRSVLPSLAPMRNLYPGSAVAALLCKELTAYTPPADCWNDRSLRFGVFRARTWIDGGGDGADGGTITELDRFHHPAPPINAVVLKQRLSAAAAYLTRVKAGNNGLPLVKNPFSVQPAAAAPPDWTPLRLLAINSAARHLNDPALDSEALKLAGQIIQQSRRNNGAAWFAVDQLKNGAAEKANLEAAAALLTLPRAVQSDDQVRVAGELMAAAFARGVMPEVRPAVLRALLDAEARYGELRRHEVEDPGTIEEDAPVTGAALSTPHSALITPDSAAWFEERMNRTRDMLKRQLLHNPFAPPAAAGAFWSPNGQAPLDPVAHAELTWDLAFFAHDSASSGHALLFRKPAEAALSHLLARQFAPDANNHLAPRSAGVTGGFFLDFTNHAIRLDHHILAMLAVSELLDAMPQP
ncbi:MAG: hypothetical protein GMKNLPBB_00363 [Myxococcota bacterium]|nr:hypothetical protein [Myxococcota bacterium]